MRNLFCKVGERTAIGKIIVCTEDFTKCWIVWLLDTLYNCYLFQNNRLFVAWEKKQAANLKKTVCEQIKRNRHNLQTSPVLGLFVVVGKTNLPLA